MSFAEWKKRTSLLTFVIDVPSQLVRNNEILIASAAYKAGERQGRKDEREFHNELAKQTFKIQL